MESNDYIKYFVPVKSQITFVLEDPGPVFFELLQGSGKLTNEDGQSFPPDGLKLEEKNLMHFRRVLFNSHEASIFKVQGNHSVTAVVVVEGNNEIDLFTTSFLDGGNSYKFFLESNVQLQIFSKAENPPISFCPIKGFPEVFGATVFPHKHNVVPGSSVLFNTFLNHPYSVLIEGTNRRINVLATNEQFWTDTNNAVRDVVFRMKKTYNSAVKKLNTNAETKEEASSNLKGLKILVTGHRYAGKTSLCYFLLNKAIEATLRPVFIDLDVRGTPNTVSGTITFLETKNQAIYDQGFKGERAVFYFGSTDPKNNYSLYCLLIKEIAQLLQNYLERDDKSYIYQSGVVIDMCGAISHDFYAINHVLKYFNPTNLFHIADNQHYIALKDCLETEVHTTLIAKPTTIEQMSNDIEKKHQNNSVRNYFYGTFTKPLTPKKFQVKFSDVQIYSTVIPKIIEHDVEKCMGKVAPIRYLTCDSGLLNQVVGVSDCKYTDARLLTTKVKYLICITDVQVENETFTVLSPTDEDLCGEILLVGELKWCETE